MANKELNMTKVLQFDTSFWMKLSEKIKKWIWADMRKGKVQEYTGMGYMYSYSYQKYKTNKMKRFTDGKRLGSPRKLKDGTIRNYKHNDLAGKNTNTSATPNMLLTGELIKGLHYLRSTLTEMIMSYMEKDRGKIEGNIDYGRSVTTLNEANMKRCKREFELGFDKNVRSWAKKRIIINVGK